MKIFSTLILCLFAFLFTNAQEVIELKNSSFEMVTIDKYGTPNCCGGARDWYSCGEPNLNTPDAQPGNFGVTKSAKEGNYYLGFVARDNETSEAISQRLERPLQPEKEYWISLALAKSKNLISVSRKTKRKTKYDKALILRIWGGDGYCKKGQLLAESEAVDNKKWTYYGFTFTPDKTFKYITFEAFYVTPTLNPYNGNLLMDDISAIIPTSNKAILNEELEERKLTEALTPPVKAIEETG